MDEFDIYKLIHSKEIKEYFKQNYLFTVEEKMQFILHSYTSVEEKRENMYKLMTENMEDRKRIEAMIAMFTYCINQIYKPMGNTLYVCTISVNPCNRKPCIKDNFKFITEEVLFYTSMKQLEQEIEDINYVENGVNKRLYIYQLMPNVGGGYKTTMEFEMTWINGKLEVVRVYPDEKDFIKVGLNKKAYYDFIDDGLAHLKLPFEDGCRLKVQTPVMVEAIYGVLQAEEDDFGCYYYFLKPDDGEDSKDLIDLSYHEIEVTSGYNVCDWVERAK